MTVVGYGTMPIIPSFAGFNTSIERHLAGSMPVVGRQAGQSLGDGMEGGFETSTSKMAGVARKAVAGVGRALGAGAVAAGAWGLSIAAANEQAEISFTTMLGSAQAAGAFLSDLRDFAARTPFEFPELQTAASSLVDAGVAAGDVIPIMTTLGDVTSGVGTGSEGVRRATVAIQQMLAAGKIYAEDLNQLRDAGIPVYDLLAAATGKAKEEVAQLAQQGKLGRSELDQLMTALESGKGLERFAGLMDKQSESLSGLASTAKDVLGQGLATAMEPLADGLRDVLPDLIVLGEDAMPRVADGLSMALDAGAAFAEWIRPIAAEVGGDLLPVLSDLGQIAGDLLPVALGAAGGSVVVLAEALGALGDVVAPVTGFLADHDEVVLALAATYAGAKLVSLLAGTSAGFDRLAISLYEATGAMAASSIGQGLSSIASGARLAAANLLTMPAATQRMAPQMAQGLGQIRTGLSSIASTSVSAGTAATAGLAAIAAGAAAASFAMDRFDKNARESLQPFLEGLGEADYSSIQGYVDYIGALNDKVQELVDLRNSGSTNAIEDERLEVQIAELEKVADQASDKVRGFGEDFRRFGEEVGISGDQVESLVKAAGLDLVSAFDESGKAAPELQAKWEDLSGAAKTTGVELDEALAMDPKVLEANAKLIEEAQKQVASSFAGFADVLQLSDEPVDVKAVADARERIADAEERSAEARREAAKLPADATDDQRESARQRISDAQSDLEDARVALKDLLATDSPLDREKISEFYRGVIADTEDFTADIADALALGYDPEFVSRMLQAGPAEAGPLLDQLTGDVDQAFIDMVNNAEGAISDLSAYAVEAARLTQMVINEAGSKGQQMAEDVGTATTISQTLMSTTGTISLTELARVAGTTEAEVKRIAGEFNLSLDQVDGRVITVEVQMRGTKQILDAFNNGSLPNLDVLAGAQVGPPRANGGPVVPGVIYPINEEGLEGFAPSVPGTVIPAGEMRSLGARRAWSGGELTGSGADSSSTSSGRRFRGARREPQRHQVTHRFAGRQVADSVGDELLFGGAR